MIWVAVGLFGLILGSFFNVCIWRIPRGESISYPPSHCPRCGHRIRFYDNIPLLSYLLLRGRCRDCRQPISIRYPIVEGLTAGLFLLSYGRFGLDWPLLRALAFISFLIVLAGIDFDHKILPVELSFAGLLVGLITALIPVFGISIKDAFWGGVIGAGFVFAAWALWRFALSRPFARMGVKQREAMGWGDLPFAALIGTFVGTRPMVVALAVAVVAGVLWGVAGRASGRLKKGQEVPFGPFLALGGVIGLLAGRTIFDWYLRLMLPGN